MVITASTFFFIVKNNTNNLANSTWTRTLIFFYICKDAYGLYPHIEREMLQIAHYLAHMQLILKH